MASAVYHSTMLKYNNHFEAMKQNKQCQETYHVSVYVAKPIKAQHNEWMNERTNVIHQHKYIYESCKKFFVIQYKQQQYWRNKKNKKKEKT